MLRFIYPLVGLFLLFGEYHRCYYEHFCACFCGDVYFHFLSICGSYGNFIKNVLRNCQIVLQNHFLFPPVVYEVCNFSESSPLLVTCLFFIAILVGVKYYFIGLWFAFFWLLMMLDRFSYVYWLSVYQLWRNIFSDSMSCPLTFLMVSFQVQKF